MTQRFTEDELVEKLFAPLAGPAGLGLKDDAALLPAGEEIVATVDALVAGVHFFADDPPGAIAKKALRVNLSDLAAKGAEPIGFLLALALPEGWTNAWLEAFAQGLGEDARAFSCPLVGGDTVKTPGPLTISITALGRVKGRFVPRAGAKVGDGVFVSGTIGDAALGLRLRKDLAFASRLSASSRDFLLDRYLLPRPRLELAPLFGKARAPRWTSPMASWAIWPSSPARQKSPRGSCLPISPSRTRRAKRWFSPRISWRPCFAGETIMRFSPAARPRCWRAVRAGEAISEGSAKSPRDSRRRDSSTLRESK